MGTHSEIQMENPQARQSATPSPFPGLKLSLAPPPSAPAQQAVLENADLRGWLGGLKVTCPPPPPTILNTPFSCRLPPPPPDLHSQLSQCHYGLSLPSRALLRLSQLTAGAHSVRKAY